MAEQSGIRRSCDEMDRMQNPILAPCGGVYRLSGSTGSARASQNGRDETVGPSDEAGESMLLSITLGRRNNTTPGGTTGHAIQPEGRASRMLDAALKSPNNPRNEFIPCGMRSINDGHSLSKYTLNSNLLSSLPPILALPSPVCTPSPSSSFTPSR